MPAASRIALNRAGKRVTPQRALIMEVIRQGKGHLDADEIYRRAREREPRLSLSTVYRTLQMLKRLGLVEELHFDDNHHHYEVKPQAEHHHLVCLGCGRVIEFNYPLSLYLRKKVPEVREFDITETEVRMTGYCAKCRRSRK
ncbi:MAG TPA: transcriptional repressor [Dehalococcoidia bacterium]|jgi:Fe2+ or Zn2+ uptake regulation protein|nr:transcriptional repressor [Dehalococcoidia bacterium]